MLTELLNGALIVLTPPLVFWLLLGTAVGLVIGVLPAIGATQGVVLFLPLTYSMDLPTSVVFLMAIYTTGQYGDSITSILINTPGGPGTIPSCWEGYPMSKKGQGARALGIATFGSMIGGVAGCVALLSLAWPLTSLALKIGPPEYFALGIMALGLVSIAAKQEMLKGLIMACFGLALSFIGEDPVSGLFDRFSFGSTFIAGGIPTISLLVGWFAVGQIIRMMEEGGTIVQETVPLLSIREVLAGFRDVLVRPLTVIRSILIGAYIGILPALGVASATVTAYLVEKKYSNERDQFGQGAPSGLVATEVSKGCCVVGDMIPTFTLGIPGSVTGAIIMTAFILHGIQPGPDFLLSGSMPYVVFSGIILSQLLIVLCGLPLVKYSAYVTKVPNALLAPAVVVLCFIGTVVGRNMASDIVFLIVFGILGYTMDKLGYSGICLLLGFILGPLVETNFHRTVSMGYGSYYLLWTRPLTVTFFGITFLFLAWPYLKGTYTKILRRSFISQVSKEAPSDVVGITMSEIIWLAVLTVLALAMVVDARSYPHTVALFPVIVSYVMLILIVCLIGPLIFRRSPRVAPVLWRKPWLSRDSMSWEWSVTMLIGYFLMIYIVGFLAATAFYLILIPTMVKYRNKLLIVFLAGAFTLSVIGMAKVFRLVLPLPFWF